MAGFCRLNSGGTLARGPNNRPGDPLRVDIQRLYSVPMKTASKGCVMVTMHGLIMPEVTEAFDVTQALTFALKRWNMAGQPRVAVVAVYERGRMAAEWYL